MLCLAPDFKIPPWPGSKILKSSLRRFCIEAESFCLLPEIKSKRPTPSENTVSPENSSLRLFSRKQTLPSVCPGVEITCRLKGGSLMSSFWEKTEWIFGKKVSPKDSEQENIESLAEIRKASNSDILILAFGKSESAQKWSAWP